MNGPILPWLRSAFVAAALLSAGAAQARPLTAVLEAEIVTLDPYYSGAYITRTFGYAVFDTLFAPNFAGEMKPQMVGAWTVSDDRLTWRFTLRDGLAFSDGAPVTATDVVASLRRWATRSPLGGRLAAVTASLEPTDAKNFTLILKEPYGLVLDTLGTASSPSPFIMPERLARTPGTTQLKEIVGSGPLVYSAADHKPGDHMLLRRNQLYVPRAEPADFLSGGKRVTFDELDIRFIPDASTAAAALQQGTLDYMQYAPFDLIPVFAADRRLTVLNFTGPQMFTGHYRINTAQKPFDDPAIRRVLLRLVDQAEVMEGLGLHPPFARTCDAFFICGSPYESDAGIAALKDPSIAAAKEALKATRYAGEPVVVMVANDLEAPRVSSQILADRLKQAGFTVDLQVMDWASLLAKRATKAGWNIYGVHALGLDLQSPLTSSVVSFNCLDSGASGYMCDPRLKPLDDAFVRAPDRAAQKAVATEIQAIVYAEAYAVPFGQFAQPAAFRVNMTDVIPAAIPLFWNLKVAP